MLSHVVVGTNDLDRSKKFYDTLLATLGVGEGMVVEDRVVYFSPAGMFMATRPINGAPATVSNGATVAFSAPSPEVVDAWHAAGVSSGGVTCEDPPGYRQMGDIKLYLAYLRDPDSNKLGIVYR